MTPYGLLDRTPLPAPTPGLTYDPATQITTQAGAPIDPVLLAKSWGENGDAGLQHAPQTGLAPTWPGGR
jgi:hypothetical protein